MPGSLRNPTTVFVSQPYDTAQGNKKTTVFSTTKLIGIETNGESLTQDFNRI